MLPPVGRITRRAGRTEPLLMTTFMFCTEGGDQIDTVFGALWTAKVLFFVRRNVRATGRLIDRARVLCVMKPMQIF